MQVHAWIETINRQVPEGAPPGTQHRDETTIGHGPEARRIAADVRIDRHGRRKERFWCDGTRLQRHELLRLTCPETDCPQAQALRGQWQAFFRRQCGLAGPVVAPPQPRPAADLQRRQPSAALLQEHALQVAGQSCTARPAVFRCFTRCPHGAHPPLWLHKAGFDLFEQGVCIGGGLAVAEDRPPVRDAAGRPQPMLVPRIPTLEAAQAYLAARSFEAAATVARLAGRR